MSPREWRTIEARSAAALVAVVAVTITAAGPGVNDAGAAVLLNELVIQGDEVAELYNPGPGVVDVSGWTIRGGSDHEIDPTPPIAAGGYLVVDVVDGVFDDSGGYIELLDDEMLEDALYYGQIGSAPLPPDGPFSFAGVPSPTLARAPDGSSYGGAPPTPTPATDGAIWTIDVTPTLGAVNDAPPPSLGASLLLNELDPKPVGGGDGVELFNPLAVGIDLAGWYLCNGDAFLPLAGTVPGAGFLEVFATVGFELEANELVYLFRDDHVRVDQIGFHLPPVLRSAPTLEVCQCYARFSDGAGPTNGWDWFSSGGGATLLVLACTPAAPNVLVTDCTGTSVGEGVVESSWGHLKARWRSAEGATGR